MSKETDLARQKLVQVYSTHDELQARMVQDLLRSAGIESMITGEMLPSLYPTNMGDMAKRNILVLESEAEEANRIIAEQAGAGWQTEE
jgi:hypothetical protein